MQASWLEGSRWWSQSSGVSSPRKCREAFAIVRKARIWFFHSNGKTQFWQVQTRPTILLFKGVTSFWRKGMNVPYALNASNPSTKTSSFLCIYHIQLASGLLNRNSGLVDPLSVQVGRYILPTHVTTTIKNHQINKHHAGWPWPLLLSSRINPGKLQCEVSKSIASKIQILTPMIQSSWNRLDMSGQWIGNLIYVKCMHAIHPFIVLNMPRHVFTFHKHETTTCLTLICINLLHFVTVYCVPGSPKNHKNAFEDL